MDKFWDRVYKTDSCWLWTGGNGSHGYGDLGKKSHPERLTHRLSWYLAHGEIPDGMLICHTCDVRLCVNPAHLYLGTPQTNQDDCKQRYRQNNPAKVRRGSQHGHHVLVESEVDEVRDIYTSNLSLGRYNPDRIKLADLANRYGVSKSTIFKIVRRETWRHI